MNIDVTGIVITAFCLTLPTIIVVAVIIGRYFEHKKRYASIVKALELGKNPEQVKALFGVKEKKNGKNGISFLRGGIVVVGVGIGLAAMALILEVTEIYAPAALVAILGIALVIVYALTRRKEKTQ
jgi:Flp pilus assembly protein TadB